MTVYIITKGEYSDYHICAVATTQERAEQLKKMYSDSYDEANIEEYETDIPSNIYYNDTPTLYWRVAFKDNGELQYVESYYDSAEAQLQVKERCWSFQPSICVLGIIAETREKAIKIACDRRAKFLAEKFNL